MSKLNHPSASDFALLFALAGQIVREPNLDGLLQRILVESRPWMNCEACSIFLPEPVTGDLMIHSAQGGAAAKMSSFRIPEGQGVVGSAMTDKTIVRVDDVSKDSRFFGGADEKTGWTTRALIAAPLLDGDNCIGAIEFLNPVGRASFSDRDELLIEYFALMVSSALVRIQSHQAALDRALVQRDLDLARELQEGLLPTNFPICRRPGDLDLFATIKPALEVSGDLYDFFESADGRIFFLVGDVSGKGVAAGLFMAVTKTLIRGISKTTSDPAEILKLVNQELVNQNAAYLFVTIILGIYDPQTGLVSYAQGGHSQPIAVNSAGFASYQPPGGQPLGVFDNAFFSPLSIILDQGETLILYSDGVTEAMNQLSELYGDERLLNLINGHTCETANEIAAKILDDVHAFVDGAERSDDITILVVNRRK
ncbi:PP2C family protein-serine/threonine phosphatase [Synechococcus sp. CS-1328]|uniref:PP2C family protein-serine/threonine phosphatase n=1 Tax=Synechococcus sp. CS-1328 TaxID=2847976 RepID=UPI00223A9FB9|nr:GAF domain-containing SpoIIE family protein phosphatase [Synechococcus sp. CS-1328]MCT0226045.1 SpoIIE family protein phosphatase [Synechococcus sp. CS-1328]